MGHFFKHMAVRLWTTLFFGSLAALVILTPVADAVGPEWMIIPGLFLLVIAYWMTGLVFTALGHRRLNRLIGEATVWERAGMGREARQALALAEATVDSFFFSPFSRKVPSGRLLAQMARFQLSQTFPESSSESVIGAYLHYFPRDREAAIKWLEGILAGRTPTRKSHGIAAGIGAAHTDDTDIQRMLAQYYLTERRCDFTALQAYRLVLDAETPPATDLLAAIVDLFLDGQRADSLALKAYVASREQGGTDPRLSSGIAACLHLITPTPLTLPLLESAEAALDGVNPSRRAEMVADFLPKMADRDAKRLDRRRQTLQPAIGAMIDKTRIRWGRMAGGAATRMTHIGRNLRRALASRSAKTGAKWTAMGLLAASVGWLIVSTSIHLADEFKPAVKPPQPVVAPIIGPYTLQVAAYLKEADAGRFVAQLKDKGLDAYWTRASGNGKTWYQVRVSHFKTKDEARTVGENMKTSHLIDDYYVANYKRPDVP
jgi:hypothetical protein